MSATTENSGAGPAASNSPTSSGTPALGPPAPAKKKPLLGLDNRFLAPLLITLILALGQLTYSILEPHSSPLLAKLTFGLVTSYSPTFVAILTAIALELILGRL